MPGFSADYLMEKSDPVHPEWFAMISGEDITPAVPIWTKVREKLGFEIEQSRGKKIENKTLHEVSRAFVAAFQEYRKEEITDRYLMPHELTPQRFLDEGRRLLGLSLFTDVWNQTTNHEVKCSFLVAGFDRSGDGHIFTVEDPGTCTNYDSLGFWAIGSGQSQALSSIFFSEVTRDPSFEALLYDLCAAKFMAESAEGVGKSTEVLIHEFGKEKKFYDAAAIAQIREMWEAEGKPRRPQNATILVKGLPLYPVQFIWEK
jgi:hypothetical protein